MSCIDLHCHLMPYVDDGAANLEESIELLEMQARQGVKEICLTPHLRSGMFGTSDQEVRLGYERLCQVVRDEGIPIKLHLGREYFFDSEFSSRLRDRTVIPLGGSNTVLVEFPHDCSVAPFWETAYMCLDAGITPLFAHVERYQAVREHPAVLRDLAENGVLAQLNASSLLGQEGLRLKHTAWKLLKLGLIHVIASDSHNTDSRRPNLEQCRSVLEKKSGWSAAEKLLYRNPLSILYPLVKE